MNGLDASRKNIDLFLSYFNPEDVSAVQSKILAENELNEKEFDAELGAILNNAAPKPWWAQMEQHTWAKTRQSNYTMASSHPVHDFLNAVSFSELIKNRKKVNRTLEKIYRCKGLSPISFLTNIVWHVKIRQSYGIVTCLNNVKCMNSKLLIYSELQLQCFCWFVSSQQKFDTVYTEKIVNSFQIIGT